MGSCRGYTFIIGEKDRPGFKKFIERQFPEGSLRMLNLMERICRLGI